MQTRNTVYRMLFLGLLAFPVLLPAQFQAPTPEELKMTADPRAPGAAAVYLNVTEITNQEVGFQSYYARIKILAEKGLETATVELPYQKRLYEVSDIQGRTIQPDGTIVSLKGKPADLLREKSRDYQLGKKVFTLPQVQVGSIIEYYYQLRFDGAYVFHVKWDMQHSYPVRRAHYVCVGCGYFSNWGFLPPGVSVFKDKNQNLAVNLEDVPPAPDYEWMPPVSSLVYKSRIYFTEANSETQFWADEGKSWSKAVNQFVEPSKAFRETVNGLLAPGDSDLDKAKKLYKSVQSLDNTDFSREKGESERKQLKLKEIKRAEDAWTQKSGNRPEIALLYLSMVRAAGLTAYAMHVVNRDQGVFYPKYLDSDQFDDTIVILAVDGKEIVLDPGEKMCPFQALHWKHSYATGLRQGAAGIGLATSLQQAYSGNTVRRVADLTLDTKGAVEGNIRFFMTGQEALYWRQIALENDESEVKKQFDLWIEKMVPEGVQAHIDRFAALDDPDAPLVATVKVEGAAGTATSKRLIVPGLFFQTRDSHPFVDQEKRTVPVDMHFGEQLSDEVVYHLNAGLTLENLPQATKVPWEGHAVLLTKFVAAPDRVTVTRTLARSFTFANLDEYPNLRGFYQKVAAADQQQLVLTISQAAKGN